MKVCRICLSKEGRLYPITSNGLRSLYQQLTGVLILEVDVDKRLPQWVCAECGLRLLSYNKLRQKSLHAHQILTNLLDRVSYITEDYINQIDREINDLKSNLTYSVIDQGIIHEYVETTQETDVGETNWNTKLKIEEINVDIDVSNVFKTEKDDDYISDTAVSITDKYSDSDSDFLSELQEGKTLSASATKTAKSRSNNTLKTKKSKSKSTQPDVEKQVDKYMTTLNKKIAKVKKGVGKRKSETIKNKTKKEAKTDSEPVEDVITVQTLSLEEQMAEFENKKNSDNYTESLFKCTDCFKGFNTEVTFARHKMMHSDKWGKIECAICKRRFRTGSAHKDHMNSHKKIYRCKECPFISNLRSTAVRHRLNHSGKIYKCPHCNVQFEHRSTYLSHLRIKHVSQHVCEICGYSFVSANGVEIHKNLTHSLEQENTNVPKDGPTCSKCKIKFVSHEALNTHLRVSHPKNPDVKKRNDCHNKPGKIQTNIICELCGIKSPDTRSYLLHFQQHPNHEPTQVHTVLKRKPHMCDQCGRVFEQKVNLISHSTVHTGDMPYECHDCNKRFKKKLYVQNHILNVHLPKKHKMYPCGICGREFNNYANRNRHVKVHSGLRPFRCEICGSSFKSKGELKTHTTHVHLNKPWPKRRERGPRHTNSYSF